MNQQISVSSYAESGLMIQHCKVCIFTEVVPPHPHSQDMIILMLQEKRCHGKINDYAFCGGVHWGFFAFF